MLHRDILQLFNAQKDIRLSYAYNGFFTQELTNLFLSLTETNLNKHVESSIFRKKVYFILVESLQNITRHQDLNEQDRSESGFFMIEGIGDHYLITSANRLDNDKISSLKEKLDKINLLDKEALKEFYKTTLSNGELSSKGGAGLGLIEMARKSGNKLRYEFEPIKETDNSFFYFQIKVSSNPDDSSNIEETNPLNDIQQFHRIILGNYVNLVYQMDFNQENILNVLSLTESGILTEKKTVNKRLFNVTVELLQNVSKHADTIGNLSHGKKGIFLIKKENDLIKLASGNLIQNDKIEAFKTKIDYVNSLNIKELESAYLNILATEEDNHKGAGLGLIDMRIKSKNLLNYDFVSFDTDHMFYSVEITLSISK